MTILEKTSYAVLATVIAISLWFAKSDLDYFDTVISAEDGVVESLTSLLLFMTAGLAIKRGVFAPDRALAFLGMCGFVAVVFTFGGGEEISWGQRIFNIESGDFFLANNAQRETNLHNLVVGDTKVNKLIFGQLLSLVVLLYLVVFPMLHGRFSGVQRFETAFYIPVPKAHHAIAFSISLVAIMLVASTRKWEILELSIAVSAFLVYAGPRNSWATGAGEK